MSKEDKPRKMSLRWTEQQFRALDDKRQAGRTTFQKIGERLFLGWLRGSLYTSDDFEKWQEKLQKSLNSVETDGENSATLNTEANRYREEVAMLLQVLASGNTIAVEALKSNLLAFRELVRYPKTHAPGDATHVAAPSAAEQSPDIQQALANLAECSQRTDETLRKIEEELSQVREAAKRGKKTSR